MYFMVLKFRVPNIGDIPCRARKKIFTIFGNVGVFFA
jgi:hypothetical protein